MKINNTSQ